MDSSAQGCADTILDPALPYSQKSWKYIKPTEFPDGPFFLTNNNSAGPISEKQVCDSSHPQWKMLKHPSPPRWIQFLVWLFPIKYGLVLAIAWVTVLIGSMFYVKTHTWNANAIVPIAFKPDDSELYAALQGVDDPQRRLTRNLVWPAVDDMLKTASCFEKVQLHSHVWYGRFDADRSSAPALIQITFPKAVSHDDSKITAFVLRRLPDQRFNVIPRPADFDPKQTESVHPIAAMVGTSKVAVVALPWLEKGDTVVILMCLVSSQYNVDEGNFECRIQ